MKLSILLALATAAASVVAQPHRHGRRHSPHNVAKRKPSPAVVYEPGAVATVIVYMVDGHQISEQEVREGIAKGVLEWGEDGKLSSSVAALPTATPTPALEAHFEELQALQPSIPPVEAPPQSSDTPAPQSTPEPQAETQAAPASPPSPPSQSPDNPDSPYEGVDKDFPNRKYECHSFPSGFGAIPYGGIGLCGWTGIQDPQRMASNSAGEQGYDDITTVPEGTCEDGACCVRGSFCSYNCPPGYLKSSWPAKQGATKQSVGGLYCNNDNTLEMADGAISTKLCIKGTDQVTVKVQNKLTKPVSICRTDYPGTEAMTLPLTIQPGEIQEVACPDSTKYYKWAGAATTAQYYINKQDVPESQACRWGQEGTERGNWAPVNFGVGYNGQLGYMALFPNEPTSPGSKLDFTVEFISDSMDGKCKYTDGTYYGGGDAGKGCTVALHPGGTLTAVLS